MIFDAATGTAVVCDDAYEDMGGAPDPDVLRAFNAEDLEHLRDAILDLQEKSGATSLPGLESVYHQISLRLRTQH